MPTGLANWERYMKLVAGLMFILLSALSWAQEPFRVWESGELPDVSNSDPIRNIIGTQNGFFFEAFVPSTGRQFFFLNAEDDSIHNFSAAKPRTDLNNLNFKGKSEAHGLFAFDSVDRPFEYWLTDGTIDGTRKYTYPEKFFSSLEISDDQFTATFLADSNSLLTHIDFLNKTHFELNAADLELDFRDLFQIDGQIFLITSLSSSSSPRSIYRLDPQNQSLTLVVENSVFDRSSYLHDSNRILRSSNSNFYVFDGIEETRHSLAPPFSSLSTFEYIHTHNGNVYFIHRTSSGPYILYKTDLTVDGTIEVAEFTSSISSSVRFIPSNGHLTGFYSGSSLFLHDGERVIESTVRSFGLDLALTDSGLFLKEIRDYGEINFYFIDFATGEKIPLRDLNTTEDFVLMGDYFYYAKRLEPNFQREVIAKFHIDQLNDITLFDFPQTSLFRSFARLPQSSEQGLPFVGQRTAEDLYTFSHYYSDGFVDQARSLNDTNLLLQGVSAANYRGRIVTRKNNGFYFDQEPQPFVTYSRNDSAFDPFSLNQDKERLFYIAPESNQTCGLYMHNYPADPQRITGFDMPTIQFTRLGSNNQHEIVRDHLGRLFTWDSNIPALQALASQMDPDQPDHAMLGNLLAFSGTRADQQAPHTLQIVNLDTQAEISIPMPQDLISDGIANLTTFNGQIYFTFGTSTTADRPGIWVSDGTEVGTTLAYDLSTVLSEGFVNEKTPLMALPQRLLFVARSNDSNSDDQYFLYSTDGTASLEEVYALERGLFRSGSTTFQSDFIHQVFEGRLVFVNFDSIHGQELWTSNGTAAGTQLLFDQMPDQLNSGIKRLFQHAGTLYWEGYIPGTNSQAFFGYRSTPTARFNGPWPACVDTSLTAEAIFNLPGATYAWQITGGDILSGVDQQTLVFTSSNSQVTLSLTVNYNGQSDTISRVIELESAPSNTPTIVGETLACAGETYLYRVDGADPNKTYDWSITGGSILRRATAPGHVAVVWADSTGRLSVAENGTCDSGPQGTLDVTVSNGFGIVYAGADQELCNTSTAQLTATPLTAGSGLWQISSGQGGSFSDANDPAATFTGILGETYTLTWTASNGTCTPISDSIFVTFVDASTTADAGPDLDVCGTTVTLNANGDTNEHSFWRILGGSGGSFSDIYDPQSQFSGRAGVAYDLQWVIDFGSCGSSRDHVSVAFSEDPLGDAGSDLCATTNGLTLRSQALYGEGMWQILSGPDTGLDQLQDPLSTKTLFLPSGGAGTYVLQWTVNNTCSVTVDEIQVTVTDDSEWELVGTTATSSAASGAKFDRVYRLPESNTLLLADGNLYWSLDTETQQASFFGVYDFLEFGNAVPTYRDQQYLLMTDSSNTYLQYWTLTDGIPENIRVNVLPGLSTDFNTEPTFVTFTGESLVQKDGNFYTWEQEGLHPEGVFPEVADPYLSRWYISNDKFLLVRKEKSTSPSRFDILDALGEMQTTWIPSLLSQLFEIIHYNPDLDTVVYSYFDNGLRLATVDLTSGQSSEMTYLDARLEIESTSVIGDQTYISAIHPALGHCIFRTNGFPGSLLLVHQSSVQSGFSVDNVLHQVGDRLIWSVLDHLYSLDTATNQVEVVFEDYIDNGKALNGKFYFNENADRSQQLYESDGTAAGTTLLYSVPEGANWYIRWSFAADEDVIVLYTGSTTSGNQYRLLDRSTGQMINVVDTILEESLALNHSTTPIIFGDQTAFRFMDDQGHYRWGIFDRNAVATTWFTLEDVITDEAVVGDTLALSRRSYSETTWHFYDTTTDSFREPFVTQNRSGRNDAQVFGQKIATYDSDNTITIVDPNVDPLEVLSLPGMGILQSDEPQSVLHYYTETELLRTAADGSDPAVIIAFADLPNPPNGAVDYVHLKGSFAFVGYGTNLAVIDLQQGTVSAHTAATSNRVETFEFASGFETQNWIAFFLTHPTTLRNYPIYLYFDKQQQTLSFEPLAEPFDDFIPMLVKDGALFGQTSHHFRGFKVVRFNGKDQFESLLFQNRGWSAEYFTMFEFQGELMFPIATPELGTEWWVSDGTRQGTRLLQDLYPGIVAATPRLVAQTEDYVFFEASVGPRRLWLYDGFCMRELIAPVVPDTVELFSYLGEAGGRYFFNAMTGDGSLRQMAYSEAVLRVYNPTLQSIMLGLADQNRDGELQAEEAEQIEVLNIENLGISNLEGIEQLPNLRELHAAGNHIRDLSPILAHPNLGVVAGSLIDVRDNELGQLCGQIHQLQARAKLHATRFYWQQQKDMLLPVTHAQWPKVPVTDLLRGFTVSNGGALCAQ